MDLLRRAKALALDISELVDQMLERSIREAEWVAENRDAIDNNRVAEDGVFSDAWRRF